MLLPKLWRNTLRRIRGISLVIDCRYNVVRISAAPALPVAEHTPCSSVSQLSTRTCGVPRILLRNPRRRREILAKLLNDIYTDIMKHLQRADAHVLVDQVLIHGWVADIKPRSILSFVRAAGFTVVGGTTVSITKAMLFTRLWGPRRQRKRRRTKKSRTERIFRVRTRRQARLQQRADGFRMRLAYRRPSTVAVSTVGSVAYMPRWAGATVDQSVYCSW